MTQKNHTKRNLIGLLCLVLCGVLAVYYFVLSAPTDRPDRHKEPPVKPTPQQQESISSDAENELLPTATQYPIEQTKGISQYFSLQNFVGVALFVGIVYYILTKPRAVDSPDSDNSDTSIQPKKKKKKKNNIDDSKRKRTRGGSKPKPKKDDNNNIPQPNNDNKQNKNDKNDAVKPSNDQKKNKSKDKGNGNNDDKNRHKPKSKDSGVKDNTKVNDNEDNKDNKNKPDGKKTPPAPSNNDQEDKSKDKENGNDDNNSDSNPQHNKQNKNHGNKEVPVGPSNGHRNNINNNDDPQPNQQVSENEDENSALNNDQNDNKQNKNGKNDAVKPSNDQKKNKSKDKENGNNDDKNRHKPKSKDSGVKDNKDNKNKPDGTPPPPAPSNNDQKDKSKDKENGNDVPNDNQNSQEEDDDSNSNSSSQDGSGMVPTKRGPSLSNSTHSENASNTGNTSQIGDDQQQAQTNQKKKDKSNDDGGKQDNQNKQSDIDSKNRKTKKKGNPSPDIDNEKEASIEDDEDEKSNEILPDNAITPFIYPEYGILKNNFEHMRGVFEKMIAGKKLENGDKVRATDTKIFEQLSKNRNPLPPNLKHMWAPTEDAWNVFRNYKKEIIINMQYMNTDYKDFKPLLVSKNPPNLLRFDKLLSIFPYIMDITCEETDNTTGGHDKKSYSSAIVNKMFIDGLYTMVQKKNNWARALRIIIRTKNNQITTPLKEGEFNRKEWFIEIASYKVYDNNQHKYNKYEDQQITLSKEHSRLQKEKSNCLLM